MHRITFVVCSWRMLDLSTGVAEVSYLIGGHHQQYLSWGWLGLYCTGPRLAAAHNAMAGETAGPQTGTGHGKVWHCKICATGFVR
jgi:hypothetical protein